MRPVVCDVCDGPGPVEERWHHSEDLAPLWLCLRCALRAVGPMTSQQQAFLVLIDLAHKHGWPHSPHEPRADSIVSVLWFALTDPRAPEVARVAGLRWRVLGEGGFGRHRRPQAEGRPAIALDSWPSGDWWRWAYLAARSARRRLQREPPTAGG